MIVWHVIIILWWAEIVLQSNILIDKKIMAFVVLVCDKLDLFQYQDTRSIRDKVILIWANTSHQLWDFSHCTLAP